jgi:DNA-binding MarR family transcriptional regulator
MSDMGQDKKVGFLLERTTRSIKLCFTKAFKKLNADITPEQWVILDTLHLEGNQSQVDLAAMIFKNTPTVSRIIDILVQKEYVSRELSEEDRRKTIISITEPGTKLVQSCYKEVSHLRNLTWEYLSDEDYDDFTRIMNQIFKNLKTY